MRCQDQYVHTKLFFRICGFASLCLLLVPASPAQRFVYGQTSLQTGNKPGGFALADFNGDGRLDVAVANESDNTVSVLLANPDGSYAAKVDYPVGNAPVQLVAADFNSDGKIDLAVVNSRDNTVSVLLGVGDGTFQAQVTYPTGAMPVAIATADFNGDNKPDLAIANQTDGTLSIFFGNGDGTFTLDTPAIAVGTTPFAIFASDMNGDGRADLLVLNGTINTSATLQLLINNGNGSFGTPSVLLSNEALGSMAVGDLNNDGLPDIAVSVFNTDQISILLGNGAGGFQTTPLDTTNSLGSGPQDVTLGDFNHDGNLDIAVYNYYFVAVYLGNGDGTFQSPVRGGIPATTVLPMMAVGDFNNDGLLDLAVVIQDDNAVAVFLGNGDGSFASRKDITLPASGGMAGAVVADLNGDGKQDLAIAQFNQPSQGPIQGFITSLLGNGNATFQTPVSSPTSDIGINGIVAADFNGDGKTDLATASVDGDGGLAVFMGNGDGTFGSPISSFTGVSGLNLGPMVAGDFNQDGKSDLVVVSENDATTNSSPMYMLLSEGNGTFQETFLYDLAYGSVPGLATADLNNDGNPDLVAGQPNQVLVFLGRGDGSFAAPVSYATNNSFSSSVVIGDFNGDGKPDIVAVTSGQILFFAGNGDGTFRAPVLTSTVLEGTQLVAGDFNGDGLLDLAMAGPSLSDSIILGNGDGTFQGFSAFQGTYYPRSFATGDVDSDGVDDLLQFTTSSTQSAVAQTLTVWSSAPVVSFAASALQFSPQPIGTASPPISLSLFNAGNAPLVVANIGTSGDFGEANTCPNILSIGQECTIQVTFIPTTGGTRTGSLNITDNANPGTQTIGLSSSSTSTPSPDFAISAAPSSSSVTAGASATYMLTLTPENDFTGTVQIACSGAPSETSCTPAESSTTLNGANSNTVTLTLTTTAASLLPASPFSLRGRISSAALPANFLCCMAFVCLFATLALSFRTRTFRFAAWVMVLFALSAASGCGGGNSSGSASPSNPGTPTGNYTLTISASSGNLTHTTTVTLIVN
jgi:FG-GAP-like repeat